MFNLSILDLFLGVLAFIFFLLWIRARSKPVLINQHYEQIWQEMQDKHAEMIKQMEEDYECD